MVYIRAVGLKVNDASCVPVALNALQEHFLPPQKLDGIGVATCRENAVLLKKIPHHAENATCASVFGALRGNCAIAQFRDSSEIRPGRAGLEQANLGPFRWHQFAAAIVGGPQTGDEANANREMLLAGLPDFLRRGQSGQSEGEAFFLHLLSAGFREGALDTQLVNTARLTSVIGEELAKSTHPWARCVVFSTGIENVVVSRDMPSCSIAINGLTPDMAVRSPYLLDDASQRERLKNFRGTFVFGGLSAPCEKIISLAPCMELTRIT